MDNFKEEFEKNCVVEKDGKKYLNVLGAFVIAAATISILNKIFKDVGLSEERKN